MKNKLQINVLFFVGVLLTACAPPENYFDEAVKKEGYIPYSTPLASVGVGTIIQGGPQTLRVTTRPERCFPNFMDPNVPTHLRWVTETQLPNSYESFHLGFGADLADILSAGNPLVNLNLGYNHAKNVKIEFEGASIEYLDEAAFYYYYIAAMEEICHEFLRETPFILQALRIEKMKFTFYNNSGLEIRLSPGMVSNIVKIGAGVNWRIEKGQELSINSPKYIGYQVGFMDDTRPGRIGWYAFKTQNNEFEFQQVRSLVPVKRGQKEQYLR